ncbi:unnamed protein product [Didymodactylos carnosus]|uniref:Uncharacterized protein n=1 Tax=Didymodactylos carnosus TaxID=1234261 RepID=A0A814LET3_9BILA|nr:unnamed protein product [Didymodactylos carnosus]CAF3831357.1 unnamed protein product [Didymodactylos carnosus]
MVENEPLYDPQIHLKFTEPDFVVLLNNNFQQEKYISTDRNDNVKSNKQTRIVNCQGDLRQPNYIQSIGYRSQWIKDFNRRPVVCDYLSKLCGEPLMLTILKSTYSHTNIGLVDPDKDVDQGHTDSVPFVIIILTCKMTNTVGGELQLIEREKQEASKLISQYNRNVPDEYVKNIEFDGPGSVIFMQGCAIQHRVLFEHKKHTKKITTDNNESIAQLQSLYRI